MDGRSYTFNGHGEYVLVKVESKNFEIQCRTERAVTSAGNQSDATIFSAFAVQHENIWVQIELLNDKSGVAIYAGNSSSSNADYTTVYYSTADYILRDIEGLDLSRSGNVTVIVFVDTGMYLSFSFCTIPVYVHVYSQ